MKNIGQDCCSVASCNTIFVDQQKNAATKAKLAPSFFLGIARSRGRWHKGKLLFRLVFCSGAVAATVPEISFSKVGVTKVHF